MKRQVVLIASLVAGLVAALLTSAYISGVRESYKKEKSEYIRKLGGMMKAVFFKRNMTKGTVIFEEDLEVRKIPRKGHDENLVYDDPSALVGRTLLNSVSSQAPVLKTDIKGSDRDIKSSDLIAKDYRAMSINVTESSSVSGMIRDGDEVDVIATLDFPSEEDRKKRGQLATMTILQKVKVLAVGGETSKSRLRSFGATSSSSSGFTTITLEVTPREAEMLAAVEQQKKGRLILTLRNKNDRSTESDLPVIEFEKITRQIQDLNLKRKENSNRRKY